MTIQQMNVRLRMLDGFHRAGGKAYDCEKCRGAGEIGLRRARRNCPKCAGLGVYRGKGLAFKKNPNSSRTADFKQGAHKVDDWGHL